MRRGRTSYPWPGEPSAVAGGQGHRHQRPPHLGNPAPTQWGHHHGWSCLGSAREEQAGTTLCCPSSSSPATEEGDRVTQMWIRPE